MAERGVEGEGGKRGEGAIFKTCVILEREGGEGRRGLSVGIWHTAISSITEQRFYRIPTPRV